MSVLVTSCKSIEIKKTYVLNSKLNLIEETKFSYVLRQEKKVEKKGSIRSKAMRPSAAQLKEACLYTSAHIFLPMPP